MTNSTRKVWLLAAVALLCFCFAQGAFADTASITLTSAGSNILNGEYVGPYTATINGVSTPVICDDFGDNSYIPESWTANVSTFPGLSNVAFAQGNSNQTQLYEEAAWLVQQMFTPANSGQVGDIQFAIWDLFDSNALAGLSPSDLSSVNTWLTSAGSADLSQLNLSAFTIYTPTGAPPTCYNGQGQPETCASAPPQELMTYSTPEPSVALMLGADLLLFGLAAVFLRRRGMLVVSD